MNADKQVEKLIEVYAQAQEKLTYIIANKQFKGQVTHFYESLSKQVQQELLKLQIFNTQWSTDITKQLYEQAYKEAMNKLEINIGDGFSRLHTDAIDILVENLVNKLNDVTNTVGRQIEDIVREVSLENITMKFATGQTIKQLQKELSNKLLDKGIGGIKDKRGRTINFTSYANMVARSTVAETQNTSVENIMKENNHDLVKMSEHNSSCPVCACYEGRVYSISGKDTRFPKLDSIPGYSQGYKNIHPNCRHRITPYIEKYNDVDKDIENSNKPFEVPKDKLDQIDKYYEEQNKKVQLRNDKKQFEKYRQILGNKAPKSFQSFRKMKYNNSKNWEEIKNEYSKELTKKDFKDMSLFYKTCSDLMTRKWYKWHDENIPNLIDRNKDIESQAKQAHSLRNEYRTQARDLMKNQNLREKLDIERPNISFEDLINSKINRKNISRKEAVEDILKTATKTNKEVNKSLGLE